jgi:hypothetical protein
MNSPADQAVLGILPAHQRLHAAYGAARPIDQRLIVQHQLPGFDGMAQLVFQGEEMRRLLVHLRAKNWKLFRPAALAWYIAVSAFFIRAKASSPSSGKMLMPIDGVARNWWPPMPLPAPARR